jgi:DNA-binding protein H-NS
MEITWPVIDMPTPDQMPVVTDAMAAKTLMLDKLAAIDAERAALVERLEAQAMAERAELIRGIRETMLAHSITLADLGDKPVTRLANDAPKKPSALTGIKVAPKYCDQATGETWSGRGLQPKWLKARIAAGAELESFAVAKG